jgi:hypothetical protein
VDLFVTVGAQVALFKELGLYKEDEGRTHLGGHPPKVRKPKHIKKWINVFDPIDVLGFAVEGVFTGDKEGEVKDYAFDNEATILNAHAAYFSRPRFHDRLKARLQESGFGV